MNRANTSNELIGLHSDVKSVKKHKMKTDLHLNSIASAHSTHNLYESKCSGGVMAYLCMQYNLNIVDM